MERGFVLRAAMVLAVATGLIHLVIGLFLFVDPSDVPEEARASAPFTFLAMGAVYFVGIGLVAAGVRPGLWIRVGIGWVLLLLAGWAAAVAVDFPGTRTPFAYADKGIEVVLLVLLVLLARSRSTEAG